MIYTARQHSMLCRAESAALAIIDSVCPSVYPIQSGIMSKLLRL